jgi:hypothetical protein
MPTLQASHILDHGEALWAAGFTGSPSGAGVRCEAEVGERRSPLSRHDRFRAGAGELVALSGASAMDDREVPVRTTASRLLRAA